MKQLIPEKQTSNKGGADSFTKMTMPKPAKTAIAAATLFAAVVLAVLCLFPGNKGHAAADVTYTDSYSNSGDFTTFQAAAAGMTGGGTITITNEGTDPAVIYISSTFDLSNSININFGEGHAITFRRAGGFTGPMFRLSASGADELTFFAPQSNVTFDNVNSAYPFIEGEGMVSATGVGFYRTGRLPDSVEINSIDSQVLFYSNLSFAGSSMTYSDCYLDLQSALDMTPAGGTVCVLGGYTESSITVNIMGLLLPKTVEFTKNVKLVFYNASVPVTGTEYFDKNVLFSVKNGASVEFAANMTDAEIRIAPGTGINAFEVYGKLTAARISGNGAIYIYSTGSAELSSPAMYDGNIWCQTEFRTDAAGSGTASAPVMTLLGNSFNAPAALSANGYSFGGWKSRNRSLTLNPGDSATALRGDIFDAVWTIDPPSVVTQIAPSYLPGDGVLTVVFEADHPLASLYPIQYSWYVKTGGADTKVATGSVYNVTGAAANGSRFYCVAEITDGAGRTASLTSNMSAVRNELRYPVDKPALNGSYTFEYNGLPVILPVPSGTGYEISGTIGRDAGSYTATVSLASAAFVWSDGTDDPIVIPWTITKKKAEIAAVDASSVSGEPDVPLKAAFKGFLDGEEPEGSVLVHRDSGTAPGTYTIRVSFDESSFPQAGNYDVTVVNGTYTITMNALESLKMNVIAELRSIDHSHVTDANADKKYNDTLDAAIDAINAATTEAEVYAQRDGFYAFLDGFVIGLRVVFLPDFPEYLYDGDRITEGINVYVTLFGKYDALKISKYDILYINGGKDGALREGDRYFTVSSGILSADAGVPEVLPASERGNGHSGPKVENVRLKDPDAVCVYGGKMPELVCDSDVPGTVRFDIDVFPRAGEDFYTYTFVSDENGRVTVKGAIAVTAEKAMLTVGAKDLIFYEGTLPAFTYVYEGFVGGDTPASLEKRPEIANMWWKPGIYEVVPAGGESKNYNFEYRSSMLFVRESIFSPVVEDVAEDVATEITLDDGSTLTVKGVQESEKEELEKDIGEHVSSTQGFTEDERICEAYEMSVSGGQSEGTQALISVSIPESAEEGTVHVVVKDKEGTVSTVAGATVADGKVTFPYKGEGTYAITAGDAGKAVSGIHGLLEEAEKDGEKADENAWIVKAIYDSLTEKGKKHLTDDDLARIGALLTHANGRLIIDGGDPKQAHAEGIWTFPAPELMDPSVELVILKFEGRAFETGVSGVVLEDENGPKNLLAVYDTAILKTVKAGGSSRTEMAGNPGSTQKVTVYLPFNANMFASEDLNALLQTDGERGEDHYLEKYLIPVEPAAERVENDNGTFLAFGTSGFGVFYVTGRPVGKLNGGGLAAVWIAIGALIAALLAVGVVWGVVSRRRKTEEKTDE